MSDPKKEAPPDEDLLEFLGGIDEVNDESKSEGEDFSDFLAKAAVDPVADAEKKPRPRPKEKSHE
jgi:hypothetical protein